MKRGSYVDFHSSEESSLAGAVNGMWKLCEIGRKSLPMTKRYCDLRHEWGWFWTGRLDRECGHRRVLAEISTFTQSLLLLLF
jgi:hypothetical protein